MGQTRRGAAGEDGEDSVEAAAAVTATTTTTVGGSAGAVAAPVLQDATTCKRGGTLWRCGRGQSTGGVRGGGVMG